MALSFSKTRASQIDLPHSPALHLQPSGADFGLPGREQFT